MAEAAAAAAATRRRPAPQRRGAATANSETTGYGHCRPPVGASSEAAPLPSPSGNRPNHSATEAEAARGRFFF